MMNDYGKARLVQLEKEVAMVNEMATSPVKKLTNIVSAVNSALSDLRGKIPEFLFKDAEEEIEFFKYIKPQFHALQIYHFEVFKIESDKPVGNEQLYKNYLEQELKYIRQFFNKYQFVYQYYLLDGSELDHSYFIRGNKHLSILLPDGPDGDPEFSTACDYLYSRFMAGERIQEYLMACIYDQDGVQLFRNKAKKNNGFKWTGETVNLVELAYGLHLTGQLNDGKPSISEIIEWLQEQLGVDVGNAYRRWYAISNRKRVTSTKFINQMRDAILKKLDDDNDFNKRK
jgi:hypothetical protein